jgi:hypothetical protein
MLMMISIIRYDLVLHINTSKQYFQKYSYISVIICWLFALIFALPPLFNWNQYIPEGLGFHCGLNWFNQSISSRLYLILAFLFVYIIPFIVLSIVNIYVYRVIRCLLYRTSKQPLSDSLLIENQLSSSFIQIHYIMRLKADRRFALATIFLVSEYLLSWTPYACIALLYLFNMRLIIEQPLFITICAFIAKISMIINPFIYLLTIKTDQMKIILFWKKCSCENCRGIKI